MTKDRLYDAFAKLIYAVVMADGVIKEQEKAVIASIVKDHPVSKDIQRYFDSNLKGLSIAQSFLHAIEICKEYGKDQEFPFLIQVVDEISHVSEGLDRNSTGLLSEFVESFKKRFD